MNGVHDLGGMHGFGPIKVEESEPVFHTPWEKHVFGIAFVMLSQGLCNLDEFRHAIERMNPIHYLGSTYYEHWLAAMETLLVEKGMVTAAELKSRVEQLASASVEEAVPKQANPELADRLVQLVQKGASTQREGSKLPRFKPGDRVVVRNRHPSGHTRCPRYARGAHGIIERVHGTFIFPDTNAHGGGEQPEAVYSVQFDSRKLWGPDYPGPDSVYLDLWESYLEAA